MTNALETARSFTRLGCEGLVRNAKAQLAELDQLDAELGDVAREARAKGRAHWTERLAHAEEALALRVAMDAAPAR